MIHMSLQQVLCASQQCTGMAMLTAEHQATTSCSLGGKEFCICLLLDGWLWSSCCTTSVLCCSLGSPAVLLRGCSLNGREGLTAIYRT